MGIRSWLKRRRLDLDEEDFKEEIRAHLSIDADERVARGADPLDARYAALRDFGNVALTTEDARRVWMPRWLERLRDQISDIRYAIRTLSKNPSFSLTVVGVLALGIGLNAAVFTMLKSFTLAPVSGVRDAPNLTVVVGRTDAGRAVRLSYPDYQYIRDSNRAFTDLFGTIVATVNLGRGRGARQIWGELVTGNYFQALGVRAQHGRTLLPSDEIAPARHPVVVLSDGLWRREFNADPAIVGRTIEISNQLLTVVGVADPAFHGTTVVYDVDVFVPVMMAPQLGFKFGSEASTPADVLSDRRALVFYPQGYLKPGTSRATAAAQVEALWAARPSDASHRPAASRLTLVPFWRMPSGAPSFILPTLGVLSTMAALVLLIACANISGLVLVRGVSRRGEIALRLALGAKRARIVRLLATENLVLAVPGALLGLLIARQGIPVLVGYAQWLAEPDRVFFNVELDGFVIGFAALVALGCTLVFGLAPAFQSTRIDLVSAINEDASPRSAARGRLRGGLVVAQVAVSLLLLVGAGLVTRSLEEARRANAGFDQNGVSSVSVDVRLNGYDEPRGRTFYRKLLDAARSDAATESAALAVYQPLGMLDTRAQGVTVGGYVPREDEDLTFMSNAVSSAYFRTLRIPLLAGREFDERDAQAGAPVAIVNHTFARRFWGSAPGAIGKRVRLGGREWRTVVGVAEDVKYSRIDESPRPYLYLPFFQSYQSAMILHTRGSGPIESVVNRAREKVVALDADLPVLSARSLADSTRGALVFFDLSAAMLFVFGIAGTALAAMGTYALVSYTVEHSTHEIGIRMALGASAISVVRRYLERGVRLGVAGAALGTVAAIAGGRLLGSVLFGVSATDAASFASALGIVFGTVVIATILPAWRAARTSPLSVLRRQ